MARIEKQRLPGNGLQGLLSLSPCSALAALLAALLAAGGIAASNTAQVEPVVQIERYGFDEDLDADGQPDLWTRTINREHPHYVEGGLDFGEFSSGKGSVRIDAGGAAAEYLSPWIDVEASAAYDVSGKVKAENLSASGLRASRAYIEVRLYDRRRVPVAALKGFPEAAGTTDWLAVSLSDVTRRHEAAALRVALVVEGLALEGAAWFDDIEVRRRPISFITTNRPANLFYHSDEKTVTYETKGLPSGTYTAAISFTDEAGGSAHTVSLAAEADDEGGIMVSYTLPSLPVGPYVVEVALEGESVSGLSQKTRLGILPDYRNRSTAKNIGLTLSELPDDCERLLSLTLMSGAGWTKLPIGPSDALSKTVRLATVAELRRADVTPVGLLSTGRTGSLNGETAESEVVLPVAPASGAPWVKVFGETINTFAGRIQAWQLGGEGEELGPVSAEEAAEFRKLKDFIIEVSFVGQVGVASAAGDVGEPVFDAGCSFISMSADEFKSLTEEIRNSISERGLRLWVWLDLSGWDYGDTGAAASRLAAELSQLFSLGVDTVFIKDPWRTRGIVDTEGSIAPFGVAFCNLIHELANLHWEGAISFAGDTPNAIFGDEDRTAVLMWPGPRPSREQIFLGEALETSDIYGRTGRAPTEDGENVLVLSEEPVILRGVNAAIIKTRQTFKVEPFVIDSIYRMQPVTVSFANMFSNAIIGELSVNFPPMWDARPSRFTVRLRPGERFSRHTNLLVPYNALSGEQEIEITLDIGGAGSQKTTILREVELGSLAFKMDTETRASGGELIVYQKVTNTSDTAANLSAFLEGEGLERVEQPPRDLAAGATATFVYRLPKAEARVGRKLRATIRDRVTDRFLNSEFTVSADETGR
ncbi:MAG: hypothetical protein ACYTAN_02200 [Planctomycetota bacterium]